MKLRKLKPTTAAQVASLKLPAAVTETKTGPAPNSGVPLKLVAPAAKQVFVAGSFNDWRAPGIPLKSSRGGEWRGELTLPPGRYEYLFVVDGQWLPDPAAQESVPNPFGGLNSVFSIS